ncbi:Hemin transport system permease protein HmuU [Halomicronema hongdechloris C2206]|uniref:Hemin transport system permease protein HmuU n=1 Tax=Halomicronema hongdechloris C2206 TaxID=1641165 RepID=A0A1Z3HIE2_9CYAN|nr:iron ABC transporter permease [Halomicronema hongdechloris]ASC70092.1 Hemin transport system permease protein HmuU [Halomicronema hongdechloris C2206]
MATLTRFPDYLPRYLGQRQRIVLATGLLVLGLGIVLVLSLTMGSVALTGSELMAAALRQGDAIHQTILWELRLPRVLAALVVGAALGLAGALLQGMLRNGLASPFLLGISAGAGLMVVLAVGVGLVQIWVPLGAWLGAVMTTLLVYLLARTGTTISVERLILGGVAFSSFFGAIQSLLLLLSPDGQIQAALNWLIGSLNGRGWSEVTLVGPGIVVALGVGCLLARQVNLLSLGDDLATGLGTSLMRSRCLIGAVATLLAAGAVSIAGLVGFVGLIVPHGVRLLVGTDYRLVLPFSALGGALVLSAADLMARAGPVELPVGVVTAVLGAPVFIWLLHRRRAQRRAIVMPLEARQLSWCSMAIAPSLPRSIYPWRPGNGSA